MKIIENMKKYPENYFNFGMTFNDFLAYLRKIIWMRANKKIIEDLIKQVNPSLQETENSFKDSHTHHMRKRTD